MSDWTDDPTALPPTQGAGKQTSDRWQEPQGGSVFSPQILVVFEVVLLAIGLAAVFVLPRSFVFYGYVACGLILPFFWAFLYMQLKKQAIDQDRSTQAFERINRVILWAGVTLSAACALLAAREWSK